MSGSAASSEVNPARTMPWSSTMTTRTGGCNERGLQLGLPLELDGTQLSGLRPVGAQPRLPPDGPRSDE